MVKFWSTTIGVQNPNSSMLRLICWTCLRECVRAFRPLTFNVPMGTLTISTIVDLCAAMTRAPLVLGAEGLRSGVQPHRPLVARLARPHLLDVLDGAAIGCIGPRTLSAAGSTNALALPAQIDNFR